MIVSTPSGLLCVDVKSMGGDIPTNKDISDVLKRISNDNLVILCNDTLDTH